MKLLLLLLSFTLGTQIFSQTQVASKEIDYYADFQSKDKLGNSNQGSLSWADVAGVTSIALIAVSTASFIYVINTSENSPDYLWLSIAFLSAGAACLIGTIGIILYKTEIANIDNLELKYKNWAISSTENGFGIVYDF